MLRLSSPLFRGNSNKPIADLCAEVFGENDWVYRRPNHPSRKNAPHLKSLDRSQLKPFQWSKKEIADYEALPPRK